MLNIEKVIKEILYKGCFILTLESSLCDPLVFVILLFGSVLLVNNLPG